MQKEKEIWTLTKTVHDSEYSDIITYRSEYSVELLSDALKRIAVWSNMKANCEKREIFIENNGVCENEITFVAENNDRFLEKEKMTLRKITLKLKDTEESS